MTPAEEIRAAALKLREAAAEVLPVSTWWSTSPWASLMHPGLAEPLASWLTDTAAVIEDEHADCDIPDSCAFIGRPLALARAINGGA